MSKITGSERLEQYPHLKDINEWPHISLSRINKEDKNIYFRNRRIVKFVLKGKNFEWISDELNISISTISRVINRALGGEEDEEPILTKSLLPHFKVSKGKRAKSLSKYKSSGARGSFKKILRENPKVEKKLRKKIKAFVRKYKDAENMTPSSFHKMFLLELKDLNWPKGQYPFDQDKKAKESCRKYYHNLMDEFLMQKSSIQSAKKTQVIPLLPFQKVQLDSQLIDMTYNVTLDCNGILDTVRVARTSLFLLKDVASDCFLSHFLCFSKEPNQDDLLGLFDFLFEKWTPMELKTPGLEYEPGAKLPSAIDQEFEFRSIGTFQLDNAFCHSARPIKHLINTRLGATLNYGRPGSPKERYLIEYAFKLLNHVIHRFPSTTGSHILDPKRESKKNSKKIPLYSLRSLEEVISIVVTSHNIKPQERLNGLSPLEYLKYANEHHPLRINYAMADLGVSPFLSEQVRTIRWYKKHNHAPRISFNNLIYKGPGLHRPELANTKITIKYDRRDLRIVEAFTLDGESLGPLYAPLTYQSFPFTFKTKKNVSKLVRDGVINLTDPLRNMFDHKLNQRHNPKDALEVVRLAREFNRKINTFDHLNLESHTPATKSNDQIDHSIDLKALKRGQNPFEWNTKVMRGNRI